MLLISENQQFLTLFVCKAITVHLMSKYIKMPRTGEVVEESVSKFYSKHGFPQCIGAIDGTHLPIKQPSENTADYINHKKDAIQLTFKLLLIINTVLQMSWSSGLEGYMMLACFQPLLWVMIFEMEAFRDARKSSLKESQQHLLVYLGSCLLFIILFDERIYEWRERRVWRVL